MTLLVAGILLLVAQLGVISHTLHVDSPKAELTCSFCSSSAPPVLTAETLAPAFVETLVLCPNESLRHVCQIAPLLSPRLSRGPPASFT
ncbi:MAG: hypothetical protein ACJ8MR_14545 [Povalibacter sp.]